jgi:hypothetical protein
MKGLLALPVVLAVFTSGARAEIIQRLAGGAACRTEEGAVRTPHVAPKPGAAAHRAANGMIVTDEPIEGADCYLYRAEAKLGAAPCPPAAVAGAGRGVAGTLGVPNCGNQ